MKEKQKICAFIDCQNLKLGVLSQGWVLDFARFRVLLRDKYNVERAFIFIGYVPGNEMRYALFQQAGYIVIFKPTFERKIGGKTVVKGNVDAELVLHAMIEYPNYDKAIIVSGDGDFHCLVEHLHLKDKLLKIIVPNKKYSSLLKKFSNLIVNVSLFREKVQKRQN